MTPASAHWQYALAASELRVANVLKKCASSAMANYNRARAAYRRSLNGKPKQVAHEADFSSTVAGIPCGIVVTSYTAGHLGKWGHPENQEPDYPPEAEFMVLDRKGYAADWLARKLTNSDREDIEEQCIRFMRDGDAL